MRHAFSVIICALGLTFLGFLGLQELRTKLHTRLHGLELHGEIAGRERQTHLVEARLGKSLTGYMGASHRDTRIAVLAPGSDEPVFSGSAEDNTFTVAAPADGQWRVIVSLGPDSVARREASKYVLKLDVPYPVALPTAEFWKVKGTGHTAVYNEPNVTSRVIARVSNGDMLRNLGCDREERRQWCRVAPRNGGFEGWIRGEMLQNWDEASLSVPAELSADECRSTSCLGLEERFCGGDFKVSTISPRQRPAEGPEISAPGGHRLITTYCNELRQERGLAPFPAGRRGGYAMTPPR